MAHSRRTVPDHHPGSEVVTEAILAALSAQGVRRVLDLGCGRGALAAALVRRGYAVSGVDPGAEAIDAARRRAPGARFHCGGAEHLPFADQSFGAVVMQNALHHVPPPLMRPALQEARRVLRPSGVLVVLEPLAQGSFFEAMRPIDDETSVRAEALTALADAESKDAWTSLHDTIIERVSRFADLDAFLDDLCRTDPARIDAISSRRDEVAKVFAHLAERQEGAFLLRQPHLLRALRKGAG